jgi:hypothetical protein
VSGDPNWDDVSLLLHMDGADASTTFTDSSTNGITVTAVGNAQIDTAQSKFGTASCLMDGTGDRLEIPSSSLFEFGTGDFTIEAFIRVPPGQYHPIFGMGDNATATGFLLYAANGGAGVPGPLIFFQNDGEVELSSGFSTVGDEEWTHVAITRSSSTLSVFVNGDRGQQGFIDDVFDTTNISIGGDYYLGAWEASSLNGHIDEVRVTKGVARYTEDFTPPTAPFPEEGESQSFTLTTPTPLGSPQLLGSLSAFYASAPTPLGAPAIAVSSQYANASAPGPLKSPAVLGFSDFAPAVSDINPKYIMRITGDPVLEIPISSWQATVQTGRQTFLQCVIPAAGEYSAELAARRGTSEVVVYRSVTFGGLQLESEMARVPLSTISSSQGPFRVTAVLSGYSDALTDVISRPAVPLQDVRSITQDAGGAVRVRSSIDWFLRPGQLASAGGIEITVGYLNYYVTSEGDAYMDVGTRG